MRLFAHNGWLIGIFALAIGCVSQVSRGQALYSDGRYVEAAHVFERTEHRLDDWSASERAEYGLYRGLTLMTLGDLGQAHHWLAYAYDVERRSPGALGEEQKNVADRAWFLLLQRVGETPQAPAAPNTAVAAHPAPPATGPAEPAASTPPPLEAEPTMQRSFVGP
jgi:tetratricopeptide (TPR) repeat protein